MKTRALLLFFFAIFGLVACQSQSSNQRQSSRLESLALDQLYSNNMSLLGPGTFCSDVEDVSLEDVRIGTISRTQLTGELAEPIPAIVARHDFVCVIAALGQKDRESQWVILGLDEEFGMLRCIDLRDEEEEIMRSAENCGFRVAGAESENSTPADMSHSEQAPRITVTGSESWPLPEDGLWRVKTQSSKEWIAVDGEDSSETSESVECLDLPIENNLWTIYPEPGCRTDVQKNGNGTLAWTSACQDPEIEDSEIVTSIRVDYGRHELRQEIVVSVYGSSIDSEQPLARETVTEVSKWSEAQCPNGP